MNWYLSVLKKYAVFSGRARREEFWMFILFSFIISLVLGLLDLALNLGFLLRGIYAVAIFIPSLAVNVRRLHDVGKSGWFLFISLIPVIGAIWLLVLCCTAGHTGDNKYGADPKNDAETNILEA